VLLVNFDVGFPLFCDHGPRASTEATITPCHQPPTELEQCPSELIGNFTGIDKEVFLEKRVYQEGASNE
jgi:hypothetical protein